MRITKEELEEFKQIYLDEFGNKLDDLEATQKALNVLKGVEMISKFNHRPVSGIDNEN